MTNFEKVAKRAELLAQAYKAIIDRDKYDNYENCWSENAPLMADRAEEHEFYMRVAKEIERLL